MLNVEYIKNPLDMFYQWEQEKPNAIFLNQPFNGKWITYTWKQAGNEIRRVAAALQAMELPPKSHIAILSKNCAHWILSDLAIMMSGHISIPLYPNINAETIEYVLEHSDTKVLFIGKLDQWETMKSAVPKGIRCISYPYYTEPGYENWNNLLEAHQPLTGNILRSNQEVVTIIYTSGTTGKPKGVVQTFKAFAYAASHALTEMNMINDEKFFSYLPLSHIAERMLVEMGTLYTGGTISFAESLITFAHNLQEVSPTIFLGVPRIWTKFQSGILEKLPQKKLDKLLAVPIVASFIKRKIRIGLGLNNAKICFTGAAPMPPSLIQWFEKIGIKIYEAYAMTENCAYSHVTRINKIRYGFVGQALPNVSVKLSPDGEILIKSECLLTEYYKEPELTKQALEDGYLHTGDQGFIDQDGYLKITGRVKELFKTDKGKYIAPTPIEMLLSKNEFIEQVCVVGVSLPQPIALVILSPEGKKTTQATVEQSIKNTLIETNNQLEKHEKVHKIVIVKEDWSIENGLLTPTLKIKRNPIEQLYSNNYLTWYENKQEIIFL